MSGISIREAVVTADLRSRLAESWGSTDVALRGDLVRLEDTRVIGAYDQDELIGIMTLRPFDSGLEIVLLEAFRHHQGIGRLLVDHAVAVALASALHVLIAVTTNDNLPALGFWQRMGFRMVELRAGVVAAARESIKPEIPELGHAGLRISDEIELRRWLPESPVP